MSVERVLIVGANAREHALAKALCRSKQTVEIAVLAPHDHAVLRDMAVEYCLSSFDDKLKILDFAKRCGIRYAIMGGEASLASGVVDVLSSIGVKCMGPSQSLARIETSKSFTRALLKRYNLDVSPMFYDCRSLEEFKRIRDYYDWPNAVIKADGLMGGKGVSVGGEHFQSEIEAESIVQSILSQGQTVVIEDKLVGEEFSLMAFCDGETIVPMPCVRDFKRAFEGNLGPNTGGMGSYSLANHRLPFLTASDVSSALDILECTVESLQKDVNERYQGVLYGGFMKTRKGIQVIEFNARFGDPEVLNVLTVLQTDFMDVVKAVVSGDLKSLPVRFAPLATVCKYIVPCDYPNVRAPHERIDFSLLSDDPHLYLGSFSRNQDGEYFTGSSRTLAYVGAGDTLESAREHADLAISSVTGTFRYRRDIPFVELV